MSHWLSITYHFLMADERRENLANAETVTLLTRRMFSGLLLEVVRDILGAK